MRGINLQCEWMLYVIDDSAGRMCEGSGIANCAPLWFDGVNARYPIVSRTANLFIV